MARLRYPDIIERDAKYTALAELGQRLPQFKLSPIMTTLVDLLDDRFIEVLAEKWSVTGYDGLFLATTQESKKGLIKKSVELHRHKGTPWSVREVIRQLGFGEIEIDEGLKNRDYSANTFVNKIPSDERWAYYGIQLSKPVTNEQAVEIRKILRNFVPARCLLGVLDYKSAPVLYNNKARYNKQYNHGSV
ncbi:TPA: phage tail protein [Haemophilus influenzae]|uniref:phage tail protein n=1 Tax=Haemophilus influenzae TaxID=727 RepID=UPI0006682E10|nr:phage tail protein [Haemophilus influenzae]KMZ27048.1 tail fiber protein [Haemophilus influenzae]MCK8917639.1 phage tail protein [Haemophilus influenzae]MDF3120720.1 phage tail protein [Haemophilus influenzae]ORJ44641.1 phage tail protein [Haemophilus influenzae]CWW88233.1 phage tail protein [Haemophilus influenzae]